MAIDHHIFVFTASNAIANQHLDLSVRNPIDPLRVAPFFSGIDKTTVERLARDHGLYAWGTRSRSPTKARWDAIRREDWVLCAFHSEYHFVARVLEKFDNPAFARAVWGSDVDGNTWNLMYFMSKPQPICATVAAAAKYLNKRYMGFSQISNRRIDRINSEFGSIGNFIKQTLQAVSTDTLQQITRADVLKAAADFDTGVAHEFGNSVTYELMVEHRPYPPKAILGLAARSVFGRVVRPDELSSGEASSCFRVLRALGFEIRRKDPVTVAKKFASRQNHS
jgi:hypothetical protein